MESEDRPGGTRLGSIRAHFFGLFVCTAGFLFGYDTGIVGGVLTLDSFRSDFGFGDDTQTKVSALIVALQQAGAFVSAISVAPLTARIGRRSAIMLACAVFCIGVILEVVPSHSLPLFYVGRVIAGLGLGAATTVVPTYSAEMAPKNIRGRLGSCMQFLFVWGVFLSYWIDYAVEVTLPTSTKQWQIPIGLQLVPAAILGLGLLTQKESVRWLVKKKRFDEAWKSLTWIRADDSKTVQAEFNEIRVGAQEEERATQNLSTRELWEPANRWRLGLAFGVFLSQQCTGATALAYFGPQFFEVLVGPGDQDLLITGLFGVIKILSTGTFIVFFSDRWGRKPVLLFAALGMSVCMIITAAVNKTHPPPGSGQATPAGIATVAMIFLNIWIYCFSWGPIPWLYVSEIFPSRIREIGTGVGVSTQWFFNFMFSLATPYMIASMAWGTFLFYAALDICMAIFVFFCIKETRGKSLEEMETVFNSKAAFDVEHARNSIVPVSEGLQPRPSTSSAKRRASSSSEGRRDK